MWRGDEGAPGSEGLGAGRRTGAAMKPRQLSLSMSGKAGGRGGPAGGEREGVRGVWRGR